MIEEVFSQATEYLGQSSTLAQVRNFIPIYGVCPGREEDVRTSTDHFCVQHGVASFVAAAYHVSVYLHLGFCNVEASGSVLDCLGRFRSA